jgi:hypothetical protein
MPPSADVTVSVRDGGASSQPSAKSTAAMTDEVAAQTILGMEVSFVARCMPAIRTMNPARAFERALCRCNK